MSVRRLIFRGWLAGGALVFCVGVGVGQILHASGPLPSFEVVTVKPWKPRVAPPPPPPPPPPPSAEGAMPVRPVGPPAKIAPGSPGGQVTDRVRGIWPPQLLIAFAYNVPFGFERVRILGGPDWINSDQYEIQAKIEDSLFAAMQKMTPAQQREQVDLMEQALLRDRFGLKVHFETREMPGFALVVAKGGPKLTAAKDGEVSRLTLGGNEMTATATTIDQWSHAPFLGGRTVVDQTGLKGTYDFTLTWSDQPVGAEGGADVPSLFTAVQEQLGLKLVATKVPVEVIVIDHIEKPSEN
jgi:bla regulator protein blaR1